MKRSKLLLISAIIGTIYMIYIFSYFIGVNSDGDASGALATMLVAPHMVFVFIALVFNWLGFALKLRWAALAAGILYSVALLSFPAYFMFVIIELVLCYVAFAKMKKKPVDNPETV